MTAITGGCQCGALRYRATGFGRASICHCRMCQKALGNSYAPLVTAQNFEWTRGAPKHFASSDKVKRGFCAECGTPMTFEYPGGTEVTIGSLDDPRLAPPVVVDLARIAFIDTIGVMLAGSREPPGVIAAEMVRLEGGAPAVAVVGQSFRSSVPLAAFANGVAGHAMDYDFSYAIGQSAAPVIPSLLAVAQSTGASSREMIEAFVAGKPRNVVGG